MEQLLKQLETNRQNFIKLFKKTKTVNLIVLAVIIAAMGATFLFLFDINQNLALIIIVVLIVAMYVYSRYTKAWLGRKTYEYIFSYYRETGAYYYAHEPFSNIEVSEQEGFDVEEFKTLGLLQNVSGIISRNTIKGQLHQRSFQVSDAGVRVQRDKKVDVAFFGKIFRVDIPLQLEGTFVLHRRSKTDQPLPDGFQLLQAIEESEDIITLGTEDKLPKGITKAIIAKFKRLPLDQDLIDATMVFRGTNVYLLLSYADSIMNVVYEKEVEKPPFVRYEDDLASIGDIVASLIK
jgi:hypothetical protein